MPIRFDLDVRALADGTPVVAVSGEIDLFTAPDFKEGVNAAVDRAATVVVDLTETTFLDSSSLGVLIGAQRRAAERGGSLVVVCANDVIVKTLRVTGLDEVLSLLPTLEDAERSLGRAS